LSSTSRENKIITRPCNPVLILLIFHQLWVRDIVVPNLDLQWNETKSDSQLPNTPQFRNVKTYFGRGNYQEELRNRLVKEPLADFNFVLFLTEDFNELKVPRKPKVICQRVHVQHVQKEHSLDHCYTRYFRSSEVRSVQHRYSNFQKQRTFLVCSANNFFFGGGGGGGGGEK
jgi:hypothetical protein